MQTLTTLNSIPKPNEKQLECINKTEGKYLVLAGPGTGKTFSVSRRIKNIIDKGTAPDRILCLTYTDAAACEMDKKIKQAMNNNNVNVNIFTFHSFCMDIIQNNNSQFNLEEVKVISAAVSRMMIKDCIDELNPQYYISESGSKYYYIPTILKGIEEIKKQNLDFAQFENNLKNSNLSENEYNKLMELYKFYVLYKQKMETRKYIDFQDMIIKILDKFKDKNFLKEIADKYEYILIDEYQDTNPLQNEIVYSLGEFCPNIFAVGDDDQTIYSFQGAKASTMQEYINNFKLDKDKVICLSENMRSTQNILDIARIVALSQQEYRQYIESTLATSKPQKEKAQQYSQLYTPLEAHINFREYKINKNLIAKNPKYENNKKPIELTKYSNELQEKNDIVKKIKALVEKKVELKEIAILAKTNGELREYEQLLKKENIDCELSEGKNIFEIPSVNVLLMYLGFLVEPELHSSQFLTYLLSNPFKINSKDYELIYKKRAHYNNLIELIEKELAFENFVEIDKLKQFLLTFKSLESQKDTVNIKEIILRAINETGILDYFSNIPTGRSENILGLKKMIDEAQNYQEFYKDLKTTLTLASFIDYLKKLNDDNTQIKIDKLDYKQQAIQLITYHSSKGREFEHVFMPALIDSCWEKKRKQSNQARIPNKADIILENIIESKERNYEKDWIKKEEKFMENAKLLFVGMTRAKEGLYLSYLDYPKKPSYFISIIEEALSNKSEKLICKNFSQETTQDNNNELEEIINLLSSTSYDYKKDFSELINYKLSRIKHFSPSSINLCLACKRRYFYEKILELTNNLENKDNSYYGQAIHFALDRLTKDIIEKKNNPQNQDKKLDYISKEEFYNYFCEKMNELSLSPDGKKELLIKGEISLIKGREKSIPFYQKITSIDIDNIYKSEYPIDSTIENENFKVIIDRIDKDKDDNYIIYDYKTGSKKSENKISPKGEYSKYYNQIAFYKYIFAKSQNIDFNKIRTIFLFPDCSEELEIFLSEESCCEVKDNFLNAIKQIRTQDFTPTPQENTCKYCCNKAFCTMDIV